MTGSRVTPEYLRDWARFTQSSPLYRRLVELIASDPELLRIINRIENLPPPNLLLGGVHYLLMKDPGAELASFYPSLAADPRPLGEIDDPFRKFVAAHEDRLVEIGRTRRTQTNECRRCAGLLPGLWSTGLDRFHLVDVGTSIGLNLAIDQYAYRWGDVTWGDSPVTIVSESRGADPVPGEFEVLSRTGLDLNPLDPRSKDDRLWLDALIWPEHSDRRRRLRGALDIVSRLQPNMVAGDAAQTLPEVLADLPRGEPAVVMTSFVALQLDDAQTAALSGAVISARASRPVFEVAMEITDLEQKAAVVTMDDGSGPLEVGRAQHHGEWVELLAQARP